MPNYLEIGEASLNLARNLGPKVVGDTAAALSREATLILERGAALTPESLSSLSKFMSSAAKEDLPIIEKTLGLTGKGEAGTVVVGRPAEEIYSEGSRLMIYEPHRNIAIRPDGAFTVISPTPSGQRLAVQNFNWKGDYANVNERVRYVDSLKDSYRDIPDPIGRPFSMYSDVITRGDSRQFGVGLMGWLQDKRNFMPAKELIDAVKATKPVDVSNEAVNQLAGRSATSPNRSGWLLGFDKKAGEALVGFRDWPTPTFELRATNPFVKNLDGLYPIELARYRKPNVTAYRDEVGKVFAAVKTPEGYNLVPETGLYAFKPSEVGMGGRTLAQTLNLDPQTGLRALGGYQTSRGGRIPI